MVFRVHRVLALNVRGVPLYGIGFNFVPRGDVIEKGATNIIIVKKNSVVCLKKKITL